MPKYLRRRNLDDLFTGLHILRLVYEFLLLLFGVTVERRTPMWAHADTSKSPLIIIYLPSLSIQVPQNRGKTMLWHLPLVQLPTTIP